MRLIYGPILIRSARSIFVENSPWRKSAESESKTIIFYERRDIRFFPCRNVRFANNEGFKRRTAAYVCGGIHVSYNTRTVILVSLKAQTLILFIAHTRLKVHSF